MQAEGDRKLRILHVIDSGGLYGAERVLLGLARQCASLGDEVVVATLVSPEDVGDPLGEAVVARGLEHRPFVVPDGFRTEVLRQILGFARARQIDVIHSHGYRANILLGVVPRRYRPCAMVCTLHGWTATGRLRKVAAYEWLERLVVRRFDRVVAVSGSIQNTLARTVPASRLSRVNNGIDVEVAGAVRTTKGGPANQNADRLPLLLAAGRLSEEKGFDLLVEAVARLRDYGILVRVNIAGDGPMRESILKRIADLGLGEQIKLLGYRKDLGRLFCEADLFVLPSRDEGMPLVLLEAMARGVPIVATSVGEVATVLEHGRLGVLACKPSVDALFKSIGDAVAGNVNFESITAFAQKQVVEKYSIEAMSKKYREEYQSAIENVQIMARRD